MKGRIKNKTKRKYRNSIRDVVIDGLGRAVIVYKPPIKHECANCYFDKLTNKSTDVCKWSLLETIQKQNDYESSGGIGLRYKYFVKGRCPICKGKGYLTTERRRRVKCKVTWEPSDKSNANANIYTAAGTEGSILVELKTHTKYYDLFKDCERIIVDGIECKLSKIPIKRGLGNKSLLIITAFTSEKPNKDSTDIIKRYG
jgi:hypothetical protein